MKKAILSSVLLLLLAACGGASMPEQTLSEKLEGKTSEERQEVLRLACLNESEYSTKEKKKKLRPYSVKHRHISDTEDTARLKALCREMTDSYSVED